MARRTTASSPSPSPSPETPSLPSTDEAFARDLVHAITVAPFFADLLRSRRLRKAKVNPLAA